MPANYDRLNDKTYRVRFGESCIMELLGGMERERHPIDGRTIRLRYVRFDVS